MAKIPTLLVAIAIAVLLITLAFISKDQKVSEQPCVVETLYTKEKDGYSAAPLMYGSCNREAVMQQWCNENPLYSDSVC